MTDQPNPSMMNDQASAVSVTSPMPEDEMSLNDRLLAELNAIGADIIVAPSPEEQPTPMPEDEAAHDPLLAELMSIGVVSDSATPPEEQPAAPAIDPDSAEPKVSELAVEDAALSPALAAEPEQVAAEDVVPLAPPIPATSSTAQVSAAPTVRHQAAQALSMPDRFELFPDGIYEMLADETADPVFLCSPLRVDAVFADQHGNGSGKLISVRNAYGDWIEIPILNSQLHRRPTEVIATLIDRGLDLAADRKAKDHLLGLLTAWKPAQRLRSVNRMGWCDDSYTAFAVGSTVIGRPDVLAPAPATGISTGFVVKGSAEDWKANVGMLCRDNPLMILAVSLAFSGPLLAPLELGGGGLHFRGASSSGKTTLLRLAASVWGGRQLITQWRATSSGLEAIAAMLNDMALPLDEIAEIQPSTLHEAIYMLTNGTGKARMTKDVVLADQARWRLALISSGEISVEEKLREARLGAMAGHEVRLIDIEADSRAHGAFDSLHGAVSGEEFAEKVQLATRDHHGAPGHAFVERLIGATSRGFDPVRAHVTSLARRWTSELPSAPDGQIARVATRFAAICVAGTLATKFRLTGWHDDDARDAAKQAFLDWYERRYGAKREAVESYVKPLQDFLAANRNTLSDRSASQPVPVAAFGWRDATRAWLPQQTWSKIFAGVDGAKAARALIDMQLMLPGEDGRLMRKAPRAIPGRPRLYTVNLARVAAYKPD